MGRHQQKYKFMGLMKTSQEIADHFGITREAFSKRIAAGWIIYGSRMIAPDPWNKWMQNSQIDRYEFDKIQEGFAWDCEEDTFGW